MKTILLLHDESGSLKPRLQNAAGSKLTQRPSEGTPGCNCDRWGHPSPDCVEHNVQSNRSYRLQYLPKNEVSERSGLLTRTAMTDSGSLCTPTKS
jgi:hypothetical protein